MMETARVTLYIPCRDYGRFLDQAVASVVRQSYPHWELLIIDDGSADETWTVASRWAAADGRIRTVRHETSRGLPACANLALAMAQGEYIMRLDADDYLDENALLALATCLERYPDVALVYPNFVHVDEHGRYLGMERRKRIGSEAKLLDLPAHGACTMVRRAVLQEVNGYSEVQDRQDGYDLWLKVASQYPVANVETPLFFYRHHGSSLSRDEQLLLEARRRIKRAAVLDKAAAESLGCCVAVVAAKNTYEHLPNVVLEALAGRPLIDYTLEAALAIDAFKVLLVSTDDPRVADHARRFDPRVSAYMRPETLSSQHAGDEAILRNALAHLEQAHGVVADTVVSLAVNCPLRRGEHIQEALDTLALFETDMVISVYEDYGLHFVHGPFGMEALNPAMHMQIRLEREALYVWNGAIRALRTKAFVQNNLPNCTVGHIVMRYEESFHIKTEFDRSLIEMLLKARIRSSQKTPLG